jgi:hypothetical protein
VCDNERERADGREGEKREKRGREEVTGEAK